MRRLLAAETEFVGALTLRGFIAPFVLDGPINREAFETYVDKVLVPEMNLGQLLKLVRAEFLVDAVGYNRVRGVPFRSSELQEAIEALLIAQLDAMIAESMVHSIKGDLEGAVPLARQCVEQSEETGATACMLASSWILGDAFYRQGKYVEARDVLRRGTDVAAVVDRKVWRPTWIAT